MFAGNRNTRLGMSMRDYKRRIVVVQPPLAPDFVESPYSYTSMGGMRRHLIR